MSEYIVCPHCYTPLSQSEYVKVVRCRDCKHCELQTVKYSDKPLFVCLAEWCEGSEGDNPLVEPNGFCAWGIMK